MRRLPSPGTWRTVSGNVLESRFTRGASSAAWRDGKKTPGSEGVRPGSATGLCETYEALRAFALGQAPGPPPRGMALFVRHGAMGWIEAFSGMESLHSEPSRTDTPVVPGGGKPLAEELVMVLAGMAMLAGRGPGDG